LALGVLLVFSLFLIACETSVGAVIASDNLSGNTYISESGKYTVVFPSSSACTWYQDGYYFYDGHSSYDGKSFYGIYKKIDGGFQLEVKGYSGYSDTIFIAKTERDNLIVNGGVVYGELFIKQ
jgi:hypothetical protein